MTDSDAIPATSAEVGASATSIDSTLASPVKPGPLEPDETDRFPLQGESAGSPATDQAKAWVRANARWLMAELDWTRAGRTEGERATLNP